MEEEYCKECGCEIRQIEDVGKVFWEKDGMKRNKVKRYLCRSCLDEQEIEFEEFTKSEEFELECYFNKLAMEDE